MKNMSNYDYYVYSSSVVARVGAGTTERLMPDGTWVDYSCRWEILTEGRKLENEKKAHEKAEQLFAKQKRRELRKKDFAASQHKIRQKGEQQKRGSMINKAIKIATKAHKDQVDKAGAPCIDHPLRVMSKMETEEEMIVAVLHDVLEDTDVTVNDLRQEGFSEEVITALESVTKTDPEESYSQFIKRAASNSIGIKVKRIDLEDNMDLSRISKVTERDIKRVEKYKEALQVVDNIETASYIVYVDDNSHYMDEDERYLLGTYENCETAISKCKDIVDQFLHDGYKDGMTAKELFDNYRSFGEDPWVFHPTGSCKFSAFTYAKKKCEEICDTK